MDDEKAEREILAQISDFASGKRKKYPTPLDRPLFVDKARLPPTGDIVRLPSKAQRQAQLKYKKDIEERQAVRWRMLCMVYGIDIEKISEFDAWRQLAAALAWRHVPGMSVTHTAPKQAKRRGAPTKKGAAFFIELLEAIEEARGRFARKNKVSIDRVKTTIAIRNIDRAFLDKWKTPKGHMTAKSLKNRYDQAMKVIREAQEYPLWGGISLAALGRPPNKTGK